MTWPSAGPGPATGGTTSTTVGCPSIQTSRHPDIDLSIQSYSYPPNHHPIHPTPDLFSGLLDLGSGLDYPTLSWDEARKYCRRRYRVQSTDHRVQSPPQGAWTWSP